MIRYRAIGFVLAQLLLALAAAMLFPVAWSLLSGAGGVSPVAWAALATAACGGILRFALPRPEKELGQREALLLVVLAWFAISGFGGLPFLWSGAFASTTDAFFESASGFTTTGATVLARVEALAEPVQLWRHLTHWIGGMGIVLLGLAVLPVVGHGGMALYRAEFSGAKSEKLKPRIAETALALWRLYLAFTVVQALALRAAGMSWLDALCHTFSTLGTGGFSTRTASVGGFASPAVEWIVVVFMLLAGMSFVQHHRVLVELPRPGRAPHPHVLDGGADPRLDMARDVGQAEEGVRVDCGGPTVACDGGAANENSPAEAGLFVIRCPSARGGAGRTGRCASRSAGLSAPVTALRSA